MPVSDPRRMVFAPHAEEIPFHGITVRAYQRNYFRAEVDPAFCGGMNDEHRWLHRDDLLEALKVVGFTNIQTTHDEPTIALVRRFQFSRANSSSQSICSQASREIHTTMFFLGKRPPEFRGYVDSSRDGRILGWVYDRFRPRKRLDVEIYSAGSLVGTTRADIFRNDLVRANIGDGRYGFSFELPCGQFPEETIAAKVGGDEFWLLESSGRVNGEGVGATLMNSTRRGLPTLRPGALFPSGRGLGCRNRRAVATRMAGERRQLRLSRFHRPQDDVGRALSPSDIILCSIY